MLLAAALMLFLCSFTNSPAPELSFPAGADDVFELPFGGAYLVFADKFGGEISKKQIEGQRELKVNGCAAGSRIFTYTLEITHAGKMSSYAAKSHELTADMLKSLKALQVGDSFEFKKTKAYLPNGKEEVDVHSRKFVVV